MRDLLLVSAALLFALSAFTFAPAVANYDGANPCNLVLWRPAPGAAIQYECFGSCFDPAIEYPDPSACFQDRFVEGTIRFGVCDCPRSTNLDGCYSLWFVQNGVIVWDNPPRAGCVASATCNTGGAPRCRADGPGSVPVGSMRDGIGACSDCMGALY